MGGIMNDWTLRLLYNKENRQYVCYNNLKNYILVSLMGHYMLPVIQANEVQRASQAFCCWAAYYLRLYHFSIYQYH